jgi:hypothetical protein
MGKPTTTKKTTTPAKRAAAKVAPEAVITNEIPAPATVTKPKRVKAVKPAAEKPLADKPAAAKPAAEKKAAAPKTPRKPKKATAAAAQFTTEEVALRAYFIAEKRQQMGQWGTPEGDWVEAERQLRAEFAG